MLLVPVVGICVVLSEPEFVGLGENISLTTLIESGSLTGDGDGVLVVGIHVFSSRQTVGNSVKTSVSVGENDGKWDGLVVGAVDDGAAVGTIVGLSVADVGKLVTTGERVGASEGETVG